MLHLELKALHTQFARHSTCTLWYSTIYFGVHHVGYANKTRLEMKHAFTLLHLCTPNPRRIYERLMEGLLAVSPRFLNVLAHPGAAAQPSMRL
jgi:hypothetical protein